MILESIPTLLRQEIAFLYEKEAILFNNILHNIQIRKSKLAMIKERNLLYSLKPNVELEVQNNGN